jgi:peroxiredoxin
MDSLALVGAAAPDFALPDIDGGVHRLAAQRGRITVLNFWSVACPWSEHADPQVVAAASADSVDLWTIACCYGESPEDIRRVAEARGLKTVLLDPHQSVADVYRAMATPHTYVIDRKAILVYRGAPDDTGFGFRPGRRSYLAEALAALKAGRLPDPAETQTRGCAIVRRLPASDLVGDQP